ncbi:hypothetical protein G8A07_00760 [Roseateles sp. DAIF2]|uniref:hypothetical protein n=1 Tax=Roseateles sp. DAIF2 TaxID=2714952 RepID=UPI0018A298BB|nr:hypothetical protein [Roseateles sp. DAIF2]QPF71597.1 hypothetical protein G8A07_00760 [Roseateles sp. DAIF2]
MSAVGTAALTAGPRPGWRQWPAELLRRERRLTLFALLLLALVLPMALGWTFDERLLRGANIWIKPIKFALSIALLALTTAWFIGHLPAAQRDGRALRRIVWLLIATGGFEMAYIALQAALGQASHYNTDDRWHALMYTLMGVGALALTATQPLLAWRLWRHPDPGQPPARRLAMLLGLLLTFLLGAGVGMVLGGRQPPDDGLPLLGWQLAGGDLRPAHFIGIHAGQLLPLAALLLPPRRRRWVWLLALAYLLLFTLLLALGLRA